MWQSILEGAYGRDVARRQEAHRYPRHYSGAYQNSELAAQRGYRGVPQGGLRLGANPFFDPSRQYCDIVLPVATWWKGEYRLDEQLRYGVWADRIMEPLFESQPEGYIAEELAKRFDVDPSAANTMTDAERT
ncbi:MAG: hypothetical protein ACLUW6_10240 [Coriobacteriaceae bacterium]